MASHNKRLERQRWDMAYWISNLLSIHTRHPVQPYELMKPFINSIDAEKERADAKEFFANFYKERRELEEQRKEE